jgi:hypothetical protein
VHWAVRYRVAYHLNLLPSPDDLGQRTIIADNQTEFTMLFNTLSTLFVTFSP